jgi:hypothetical protein
MNEAYPKLQTNPRLRFRHPELAEGSVRPSISSHEQDAFKTQINSLSVDLSLLMPINKARRADGN